MEKRFIGHTFYHLYPTVTHALYILLAVNVKPAVIHINPEHWGQKYDLKQNNRFPLAFFKFLTHFSSMTWKFSDVFHVN